MSMQLIEGVCPACNGTKVDSDDCGCKPCDGTGIGWFEPTDADVQIENAVDDLITMMLVTFARDEFGVRVDPESVYLREYRDQFKHDLNVVGIAMVER